MKLRVNPGRQTGEVSVSGLADEDGRGVAYVLSFEEARDLARMLTERAGTPDREPPDDVVRRERLEKMILEDSDARTHAAHVASAPRKLLIATVEATRRCEAASAAIDAEAELIRSERLGAAGR